MKYDLVCYGEVLYDVYSINKEAKENKKVLSGAPLTTASIASKLGLKTGIISAINKNQEKVEAGRVEKEIFSRKVHSLIQKNSKPTGKSIITLDKNKIPKFKIKKDVAYDYIEYNEELQNLKTKYFCFGTLTQRNKKSRETLQKLLKKFNSNNSNEKTKTIYDVNIREGYPWKRIFKQCLPYTDILKINEPELKKIKKLLKIRKTEKLLNKVDFLFVTKGDKGASVYYKTEPDKNSNKTKEISLPVRKVDVKDTTGCGDAFTAGIVYEMAQKYNMKKVLRTALKVSSKTASHLGAYKKDIDYR